MNVTHTHTQENLQCLLYINIATSSSLSVSSPKENERHHLIYNMMIPIRQRQRRLEQRSDRFYILYYYYYYTDVIKFPSYLTTSVNKRTIINLCFCQKNQNN